MMTASMTRRLFLLALGVTCLVALPVAAQQQGTTPAEPPKEEVPFWAIGRPSSGPGAAMAPVPAFPIPTPADKLPIAKMKLPPGWLLAPRLTLHEPRGPAIRECVRQFAPSGSMIPAGPGVVQCHRSDTLWVRPHSSPY